MTALVPPGVVLLAHGGQRALADGTGHRHDDVRALGDELLGDGLALGGIGEVADEGARPVSGGGRPSPLTWTWAPVSWL